ncbi:MAG: BON domain-containing protein [Parachlamydia sp.]|jgi:osmotically-inducible protein OsmY|nr:BON domain-containing protein [Parachlamydia sp.]
MKNKLFLLSSLCLVFTACDNRGQHAADNKGQHAVDNTGRNERDRSGHTMTSGDQSENDLDRAVTQKIRQAIVGDEALSTNAKNVKIITVNGVVTLRGVVNNDREKNEIARKTKEVSGVNNVDNQLEVKETR